MVKFPLTQKERDFILSSLPENERDLADRRINLAESIGIYAIGLWTGEEDANILDLVGVSPDTGMVVFLREPAE